MEGNIFFRIYFTPTLPFFPISISSQLNLNFVKNLIGCILSLSQNNSAFFLCLIRHSLSCLHEIIDVVNDIINFSFCYVLQTPLVIAIRTIPMCITKSLIEGLVPRNERDHQLKDRDFALIQEGDVTKMSHQHRRFLWKCRSATPGTRQPT